MQVVGAVTGCGAGPGFAFACGQGLALPLLVSPPPPSIENPELPKVLALSFKREKGHSIVFNPGVGYNRLVYSF